MMHVIDSVINHKELLFYALCEVAYIYGTTFTVKSEGMPLYIYIFPIDDAPWVKVGQKIAIEVAYHTSPGGSKMKVTTISSIDEDVSNE